MFLVLNMPPIDLMRRAAFYFVAAVGILQVIVSNCMISGCALMGKDVLDGFFNFGVQKDQLSLVVLLAIGIVIVITSLLGNATIKETRSKFKFFNLLLIALIGMNSLVMVRDVFSLYVFIEVVAVSSFIMIAMKMDEEALEGAFKYIIMSIVATMMMLFGVGLFLISCGGTHFTIIEQSVRQDPGNILSKIAMGLFMCGLFVKSGIVPFHGWLPDAYSKAPSAASVLLAGIITKVSGVYVVIRMAMMFSPEPKIGKVLMFVGALSILIGAIAALTQSDFKRMLAYSSISQVGYIILAAGCGTGLAIVGAVFHFFNHAIFKTLLFVNAASLEESTGSVDMDRMGGLAHNLPAAGITSMIGFLSTAGIPPLAGFWSKLIIIIALWQAKNYGYAVLAVLASVITLGYLLSMQRRVFFGKPKPEFKDIKKENPGIVLAEIILAVITIAGGLMFPFLMEHLFLPLAKI